MAFRFTLCQADSENGWQWDEDMQRQRENRRKTLFNHQQNKQHNLTNHKRGQKRNRFES